MVSLFGFVVAIGVLVVQIATGTLSPRFMRLWCRDRLQKVVLTTFVGTIALSFSLLRHAGAAEAPNLGVTVAGWWRPARGFVDYLQLAVTEIRQYGGRSTQVCRQLERTIAAHFPDAEDRAFARTPDRQGIGGPR